MISTPSWAYIVEREQANQQRPWSECDQVGSGGSAMGAHRRGTGPAQLFKLSSRGGCEGPEVRGRSLPEEVKEVHHA